MDAVNSLRDWEKGTLADVDPKFKANDDSDSDDDEETKKRKQAEKAMSSQSVAPA